MKQRSPTGSKKEGHPLSNADRQRRYQQRHKEALRQMRAMLPTLRVTMSNAGGHRSLRVTKSGSNHDVLRVTAAAVKQLSVTRNTAVSPATEESIDDALTQHRQLFDHVTNGYMRFLTGPGLTDAEIRTIRGRFKDWLRDFDATAKTTRRRGAAVLSPRKVGELKNTKRRGTDTKGGA